MSLVDLDEVDEPLVAELQATLSNAELLRAAAFRFAEHRRRFVVCRGMLRRLLAERLGVPPDAIEFSYGPWGKPAVRTKGDAETAHFNVSRSGSSAVIALGCDRAVGVDVERTALLRDVEAIARRYFSDDERARIVAVPPDERARAFARCWTRREAVLKADGIGLSGLDMAPGAYEQIERGYVLRTRELGQGRVVTVAVATTAAEATGRVSRSRVR